MPNNPITSQENTPVQNSLQTSYSTASTTFHRHTGVDSPKISYTDLANLPIQGTNFDFGDGSDGAVTLNGTTTYNSFSSLTLDVYSLTRDIFVSSLVINTGVTLAPSGYRVFCSGTTTINGTISVAGGNGGTGGAGGASTTTGGRGTAGVAGTASTGISTGSLTEPGNGPAGKIGMIGGANANPNLLNGLAGTSVTSSITANGGAAGGNSGSGGVNPGAGSGHNESVGGTASTATQITKLSSVNIALLLGLYSGNPTPGSGAGGGSGVGINGNDSYGGGGGGGGAGAAGGIMFLASKIISISSSGTVTANGGNGGGGGNGGNASGATGGGLNYGGGGGGGGAAGNGGFLVFISTSYTNAGSVTIVTGTIGAGGMAGSGSAYNGSSGNNGGSGHNGQFTSIIVT